MSYKTLDIFDELAFKAFRWFVDNAHPVSGMVKDRAGNFKGKGSKCKMSSIASTGYYLSALPYAVERGWIENVQAEEYCLRTLRFVIGNLTHHFGLLYHFVDWQTGQRWDKSEYSLLDTSIFLNGCMVVSEAFSTSSSLANYLIDRVQWSRYLVTHPITCKSLLSFGWLPENGGYYLYPADVRSSELAMPYLLAAGSRTYPIQPEIWYNTEVKIGNVCGYKILNPSHALFTSYYGLGWADLRGLVDKQGIDFHKNAKQAALANRLFCQQQGATNFCTYRSKAGNWWGLSAGDSPAGYVARGPISGDPNGTVWPVASLAAIVWIDTIITEDICDWQRSEIWAMVNGMYGLSAFSIDKQWIAEDLIGIDIGSFLINWANYNNESVWRSWMRHPVAIQALQRLNYFPIGT